MSITQLIPHNPESASRSVGDTAILNTTDMRVERFASFAGLPESYRQLSSEAGQSSFDQTIEWFETLAQTLSGNGIEPQWLGVVSNTSDAPLALLPLLRQPGAAMPGLGTALASLSNYYTAHFRPIVAQQADPAAIGAVLGEYLRDVATDWHWLDFNPIDADDEIFRSLSAALSGRGYYSQSYFRFGNWVLDVAGRSFDDYFAGLPSRVRNTANRKERKLHKETSTEIVICKSEQEVDSAVADYWKVYEVSWKQAEPHPDFVTSMVRQFAAKGWLRLGVARVDGVPAAAQIWFVKDGTASIFKLAYDPQFARYSIGSTVTKTLMREALDEDKVRLVDYLCGDDSYKKDWMSERRVRSGLRIFRLGKPLGLFGAARARGGQFLSGLRERLKQRSSSASE